jgi:hypothetical protein
MNAIANTETMSPATVEQVLGTGNLANLSPAQRVELMLSVCRSRGLNPLTRPFRFLSFQGQVVMYATRDCGDQLRKIDGVNVEIAHKGIEDDLYVVEVRATDKTGRHDTDLGAVQIGALKGEARANAIMRAITKAKRRVTLSISGLGLLDETEALGLPGAKPLDDDVIEGKAEPSERDRINESVPLRAATAPMPRGERVTEAAEPAERTDAAWQTWLDKLRAACAVLQHRSEVVEVAERRSVADALATSPGWVKSEISAILAENYRRFGAEPEPTAPEWPGDDEVAIAGEEKVGAG